MKNIRLFHILCVVLFILVSANSFAQPYFSTSTTTYKKPVTKVDYLADSIKKQFEQKKLVWPPKSLYIRSFKYDRLLEVWVKNNESDSFRLFKTYKVCMQSGTTGPKRSEGDFQVPEGFYYINEFNSNSNYHMALGLNYPNASDKILSDADHPGGAIYIHGNCVSTGCIAIQDEPIEELYLIAAYVKANGEDFIPVHVFPVKYNVQKSVDYLSESFKSTLAINKFILNLKKVFDYFELHRQLPVILVNKKGEYMIN
ncbi:MAG: L,D-transpeptidase family protein [Ferruginibacter sp.]|nr:L,D-transpeptidase family protein [Ferruginibacter sp.]